MHSIKARNGTFGGGGGIMELQAKNFGIQTHFNSVNNMGLVISGHTSSSVCKPKMSKMVLKKNTDLIAC